MYIESVILDGFKSYWRRTVVSGFDPTFNAITGLNGSGKSNILDAICFVLGISNLSQVRVSNLQELVYKQGQTGVTRAIVEIIFNNEDKAQSPLAYELHDKISVKREVNISGKNKYYINGQSKPLKVVQNFFHSVQLNVNNPHFLIMQGRITKVLNMKPEEILAMIEEAAGTRMFERNKRDALRTLEKKETKVQEINRILAEDITPTLDFLSKERAKMIKFMSNNAECERLTRFCVAFDFSNAETMFKDSGAKMKALEDGIREASDAVATAVAEEETVASELTELRESRDTDLADGVKQLTADKNEKGKLLAESRSNFKNKTSELADERKTLKGLNKQLSSLHSSTEENAEKLERQRTVLLERKESVMSVQQRLDDMQARRATVAAGMTEDADGTTTTIGEQLMQAQRDIGSRKAEIKSCQLRIDGLNTTIKRLRAELKAAKKGQHAYDAKIQKAKAAEEKARTVLSSCRYSKEREDALQARQEQLRRDISDMMDERSRLEATVRQLEFRHNVRSVSRHAVKGRVAELITVEPEDVAAIETAAGGKLYSVVVDEVDTGKRLLASGSLKQRTTFVPLDKIDTSTLPAHKVETAQSVDGRVRSCLDAVSYDPAVEPAMRHVFGRTLVCPTEEVAAQVSFARNKADRSRSVTPSGTLYEPVGVMEGGGSGSKRCVLQDLQNYKAISGRIAEAEAELAAVERELEELEKLSYEYERLSGEVEMTSQAVALLEGQRDDSSYARLERQLAESEAKLDAEQEAQAAANNAIRHSEERMRELEIERENMESAREARLKEVEEEILTLTQDANEAQEFIMTLSQEEVEIETELKQSEAERSALQDHIAAVEKSIAGLEEEVETLKEAVREAQEGFTSAEEAEAARRRLIDECKAKIREKEESQREALKEKAAAEKKLKELQKNKSELRASTDAASALMAELAESHPWIEAEKHLFGRQGTDYDFSRRDPSEASAALRKLEVEQATLSKQVNKKAMGLMETAEKEYQDVMNKKRIIANDKKKIEEVIAELDEKKNEALRVTWEKVNRDFGSIFSTLLPGTSAKLEPPAGGTVLDGLEVRVAFNGVWKESLTELSGGQRSLLALSLILSLLLFKPAPMYILDEVDAALDLSHTQNIGHMLKTHFARSQFIVVSLKQGMFNNANVVFRTSFENGESKVTRTLPTSAGLAGSRVPTRVEALVSKGSSAGGAAASEEEDDDAVSDGADEENFGMEGPAPTGAGAPARPRASTKKRAATTSRRGRKHSTAA